MKVAAPVNVFKKLNISEQEVQTHSLRVPIASNIRSNTMADLKVEDLNETKKVIYAKFKKPAPLLTPAFDANYFGPIVHELLKDKVVGYMFQVYKGGNAIYTGQWNWARILNDGSKGWTADTRMHVASVSKMMTAIGLVKLLDQKKISLDDPIAEYLPTYWKRGNGVASISFRQLLNHTSGFSGEKSRCDYPFMKEQVEKGPNVDAGTYANVNFSIMRVLITIINGRMAANFNIPNVDSSIVDTMWDVVATKYFQEYLNKEVFSVAGLPTIGFKPEAGGPTAKAYSSMTDKQGREGNWSTVSGGAGMYMSVAQILKTLHAFRNGKIVATSRAQYMLDHKLGINSANDTPAGKVYTRLGMWSIDDGEEQTAVYCLPNNVNIAVCINSPVKDFKNNKGENRHVHGLLYPAIEASIH
ncbi:serine hydrolase domain-containing protein [Aridibaculum aurantiacum]|uniref:serine hydrolase domain-containing protein n=1 Tax=Aridibaculum aurantiacum TaxID=2810307 RepID=UPI001A9770B4|nr:serine hydrolase domain-containing protein [Aridibaculum aurantiacum]